MKSTMITAFGGALASITVSAVVVPQPLDVWVPKITSPTARTVWHIGKVGGTYPCSVLQSFAYFTQATNVTWDTSDAPKSISNKFSVVLRTDPQSGLLFGSFGTKIDHILLCRDACGDPQSTRRFCSIRCSQRPAWSLPNHP
jgi:hypothetical protein